MKRLSAQSILAAVWHTVAKTGSLAVVAALLLSACGGQGKQKDFKTHSVAGKQCLFFPAEEEGMDEMYLKKTYSLVWPDKGVLAPEAERELLRLCFGDSTATDFDQALEHWRNVIGFWETATAGKRIDTIDESQPFSYDELTSTCRLDSNLALFEVGNSSFVVHAAHGIYSVNYLTVDANTGKAVHLSDLMDTTHLGEAVARAIQDLEVNESVRECLFDEFRNVDRMPVSRNFFIDSTRSTINLSYGLYWITPYCCGIQNVVLPIFWLSKHVPLTPYAKELFGPGCSID